MEISWFGETCVRLRGREGTVVADAFRSVVGPTGRGVTSDIVTYSHPEDDTAPSLFPDGDVGQARGDGIARPTSLEGAFMLSRPGEFEVHEVLITGVRTFRDDRRGVERGLNVAFVYELEGLHAVHLGDVGHLLTEEMVGEIGSVDVVCVPIGAALPAARAAELVAQLDANLVIPMPIAAGAGGGEAELARFLHEMSVQHPEPVPRLVVTVSSVPQETAVVLLEPRARG